MHKTLFHMGILTALMLIGTAANAACYNVYNGRGKLVVRTPNPPVNMSQQLHNILPQKYGQGASMVFEAPVADACSDYAAVRTNRHKRTIQDTNAILDNLARLNATPGSQLRGQSGQ